MYDTADEIALTDGINDKFMFFLAFVGGKCYAVHIYFEIKQVEMAKQHKGIKIRRDPCKSAGRGGRILYDCAKESPAKAARQSLWCVFGHRLSLYACIFVRLSRTKAAKNPRWKNNKRRRQITCIIEGGAL